MPQENDLPRRLKRTGIVAVCLLGTILVAGTYVRFSQAGSLRQWTLEARIPTVALITPAGGGHNQQLSLPGTLQAFNTARLFAQVPGYVHAWFKDIGARVAKGELLATIDTPEVDQQISQARADLASAISAQKLSAVTAVRWQDLMKQDAVARQDVDEKEADLAAKTDAVKSAKANLDRLLATKAFARIVAPFDGVVTQRAADIGALVSTSSTGDPLFTVADTHVLRLYVSVPQSYSAMMAANMSVSLGVPEYPGRVFPARLDSTADAISSSTSTMLVQFLADNSSGLLKPGAFAQVDLGLPAGAALRLPASALMFRAAGLQVATVGSDDRVTMKPIRIGTDLGTQVIVASGLNAGDRVVDNPPDSLSSGDRVRVAHGG